MFLIYAEGRRKPARIHYNLSKAIQEAERLCKLRKTKIHIFAVFSTAHPEGEKVIWETVTDGK
jgi:hypothetical protein